MKTNKRILIYYNDKGDNSDRNKDDNESDIEKHILEGHGDQRDADDEHVQHVESGAKEGAFMQHQPVRDQFQEQLERKYASEEHVELTEQL